MALDRLTGQDLTNIVVDEFGWPGLIGVVAMVDGDGLLDPTGRDRLDQIRRAIAGRLTFVPRLRQRVCTPLPWLGGPLWVDVPAVDLAHHVQAAGCPPASRIASSRRSSSCAGARSTRPGRCGNCSS